MDEMLKVILANPGIAFAAFGAIAALILGGIGSAQGIAFAGSQGAGVLSEKPNLFGKVFVLILLPGTQGLYGFVFAILLASNSLLSSSLEQAAQMLPPNVGFGLMFVGIGFGLVLMMSARSQGLTAAAAINLVSKKEEQFGRAIILPALVETYAVLGLVVAYLYMSYLLPSNSAKAIIEAAKTAAEHAGS